MTQRDPTSTSSAQLAGSGQASGPGDSGEGERLAQALDVRFAPHQQAASAAVREAEHRLADARAELVRAREAEASQHYRSDPLVFMRASLADEVESLTRKTTPKKVRVAYRYLIDRAAELAEGEVSGYRQDESAAKRERERGVAACLAREGRALDALDSARAMQERVAIAEQTARQGLAVMVDKLADQGEASGRG